MDPDATRIILARHGGAEYESDLLADVGGSLTMLGREQARDLGDSLVGEGVGVVVCSSLARAVQTAELAAAELGLPVTVREGLQEFGPGDHLGSPFDAEVFDPVLNAWYRGDLDQRLVGAETGIEISDRMFAVLDRLADLHVGQTLLVVSHGGAILTVLGRLRLDQSRRGDRSISWDRSAGLPQDARDVPNCSAYTLERDATGWHLSLVG